MPDVARSFVMAGLFLLVSAGCARSVDTNTAEHDLLASTSAANALETVVATDPFLLGVEQELASRCMAGRGFVYEVVPVPADAGQPSAFQRDLDRLREEGYGAGQSAAGLEQSINDPNQAHIESLDAAGRRRYTTALFGDDSRSVSVEMPDGSVVATNQGGCLSESRVMLYKNLREWLRLDFARNNLVVQVQAGVLGDPGYVRAAAAWRACMARLGYPVDSPGAAADLAASGYASGRPDGRRGELAIATADAGCDHSSDLTLTAKQLLEVHQARVLAAHEADLVALAELSAEAVERARALLAAK